jgi:hypothetical protein
MKIVNRSLFLLFIPRKIIPKNNPKSFTKIESFELARNRILLSRDWNVSYCHAIIVPSSVVVLRKFNKKNIRHF